VVDLKGVAGMCDRDVGNVVVQKVARSYVVVTDIGTILLSAKALAVAIECNCWKTVDPVLRYVIFSVILCHLLWHPTPLPFLWLSIGIFLPLQWPFVPAGKPLQAGGLISDYPPIFIQFGVGK
jgi:hypothetical protein